ncbi:hypothetical protein [Bacillus ndiopicus]|uniref:hypothetical protein n=1 Tax=Bacillus ndiopicus TaxID=1347368 RepID=UPI0005A9F6F7|nr:hypothetical protein [Bacillus ndiopicus]
MTLYRFLASKSPMPEAGDSGFREITKEAFEQLTEPVPYFTVPYLPDKVIIIDDLTKLEQFQVVRCLQLPEDTGGQIQRPYIYELRGNVNEDYLTKLVRYLQEYVKEQDKVELWSLWHGESVSSNQMRRLDPQNLSVEKLAFLGQYKNNCIKLWRK